MMTTKRFNALDADLISSSRAQQGGGDGVPLGHPGPGHLGDQLHPQDPLARGRLGPAQGELMFVLQL